MTKAPEGPRGDASLAERLAALPDPVRAELLESLGPAGAERLSHDWRFWARPKQWPPAGAWFCWLALAGRGFGKTRLGVEWLRLKLEGASPLLAADPAAARIALIADTAADARDIMVMGESGFLACCPKDRRPAYEASKRRLVWPSGAQAVLYSAEDPDQLRGPQHHLAWADELAKWRYAEAAWSNLILGLRLGARPQVTVTTTPRPLPILKQIMAEAGTVVTRGSTWENKSHLPKMFLDQIESRYAGTRLGRQEIDGEILETVEGALWRPEMLEPFRVRTPPDLNRVVVAVDPPVTGGPQADACGIVAAGAGGDGHYYVLADHSRQGAGPADWAGAAVALYHELKADRLVAEVNNGGDLVEAVIRQIDPHISYKAVRASRGKRARAEPVAALYERGLAHHVGTLLELEAEMTAFVPGAPLPSGARSPDRLDALVWALTDLALSGGGAPRIRPLDPTQRY